jgi:hypothetical protein
MTLPKFVHAVSLGMTIAFEGLGLVSTEFEYLGLG